MKILKVLAKWTVLFWLAVGLVFGGLWLFYAPDDLLPNSESQARLDQSEYAVGKMDLEVIDLNRSTPSMGKFKGDDKRTLKGTIWFPKGDSSGHPLIIYSHGFGGHNKESSHINEYLASNGYVVAAVNFPLSNGRSPAGLPQLLDVVNQPADVSAVIDWVLALNEESSSSIYGRLDPEAIGAMGLSLGGLTTALAAFHPDLKDDRIKVAVMMAPPLEAFSERFFATSPDVRSLLLSGSMDRVVPEATNATQVMERDPNSWFISLDKGTHLGFANVGNPIRWMDNPDDLGCALMGYMLPRLDLPERWDAVIDNTDGVMRDIIVSQPCPDLPGKSMNGLRQQWLTRIAIGSFFDMYLASDTRAKAAREFFTTKLDTENPELSLAAPR